MKSANDGRDSQLLPGSLRFLVTRLLRASITMAVWQCRQSRRPARRAAAALGLGLLSLAADGLGLLVQLRFGAVLRSDIPEHSGRGKRINQEAPIWAVPDLLPEIRHGAVQTEATVLREAF